jgi:hypothetical protein
MFVFEYGTSSRCTKGRSKIVSCLYVLPPIHKGEELSEATLEVSENFNEISPGGKFSLEMIEGFKGPGVSNLWMLDRSEARWGDDFMEWNCYHGLDILQLGSGVGQHSRADNMRMGFVWMRLPHPLLNSTCKYVWGRIPWCNTKPGEVRKIEVIRLWVERPFMLTPQAIHADNSIHLWRGRIDRVHIGGQNDMA